MKFRYILVFHS